MSPSGSVYQVKDAFDVYAPRQAAYALARELGFASKECQELAIVVSELASNIVKYGVRGSIELEVVSDALRGCGILILARDRGPAFRNLAMALQDGCDDDGPIDPAKLLTRRGLGIGLGAVARLSDSFEVEQVKGEKRIRAIKYLKRPTRSHAQ